MSRSLSKCDFIYVAVTRSFEIYKYYKKYQRQNNTKWR